MCAFLLVLALAYASAQETLHLPAGAELIIGLVKTSFRCPLQYGYYADVDNDCKIFHVCNPVPQIDRIKVEKYSFMCGNMTVFDQLSQTCMIPEYAIPCSSAADFFYLNNRIGQRDIFLHGAQDIDKAEKLVPFYSKYLEAPTRNNRPAGKPQGFQKRHRNPASFIREDRNVTTLSEKINPNRQYVPYNGGLLNVRKNPAAQRQSYKNTTRRKTTPSFGSLPGYGNRFNLDVINFRDENFRVRQLSVNDGLDSPEGIRRRDRAEKKFVTSVERLPAESGEAFGKIDSVANKNVPEVGVKRAMLRPIVAPKTVKKDVTKQKRTTATPIKEVTRIIEPTTESTKRASEGASNALMASTSAPTSKNSFQTESDQALPNEPQSNADKMNRSKQTDLVPTAKKTTPGKNKKGTILSKSTKTTTLTKSTPKPSSAIASTEQPVALESDTQTSAPVSTSSVISAKGGHNISRFSLTPEKPSPSAPVASKPAQEITTLPVSTATSASSSAMADTTLSTTAEPTIFLSTLPLPTSKPQSVNTSEETIDKAGSVKQNKTSSFLVPVSELPKAKANKATSSATTLTTAKPKAISEQPYLKADARTASQGKTSTDSPKIVVTLPSLLATSSTITEHDPMIVSDEPNFEKSE